MILRRAEDTAASLSRNKGVRLIVNHPTPGYVLNLDAQLTGTLLSKLLENALSHTRGRTGRADFLRLPGRHRVLHGTR